MKSEEDVISIIRCNKVIKDEFQNFQLDKLFYLTFSTDANCYLTGFGILKGIKTDQQHFIIHQKVVQENQQTDDEERVCFEDNDMYETQQKQANCGELHFQKFKTPVQIQANLQYSLILYAVGQPTHIGFEGSFKKVVTEKGLTVTFKDVKRPTGFQAWQQSATDGTVLNLMFKMDI